MIVIVTLGTCYLMFSNYLYLSIIVCNNFEVIILLSALLIAE